jgi:hypothetical protein
MKAVGDLDTQMRGKDIASGFTVVHLQFAHDSAIGNARHDELIARYYQMSALVSHEDGRTPVASQILAADLKFASRYRGKRFHFRDQRTGSFLGLLCFARHASVKF